MSAENIHRIYEEMMADDAVGFKKALCNVQYYAGEAQKAFDELAEKNADLGAGVILPILRCLTSHVMSAATNPELPFEARRGDVGIFLAPLVVMHYDVYTRECLDGIDSMLNVDFSEGEQK